MTNDATDWHQALARVTGVLVRASIGSIVAAATFVSRHFTFPLTS
jgi:hypothetical protein